MHDLEVMVMKLEQLLGCCRLCVVGSADRRCLLSHA
eukprot:COSAG06_NODE_54380_length_295_cov_0.239796_2_plen_35_part_01